MIETAKQKFKDKIPPSFLALFFVSILLVGWFCVRVVNSAEEKILSDMEIELARLERSFTEKADHTFYVMNNILLQISSNPKDKIYINKILSQYHDNQQLAGAFSWTIFSWSDDNYQIIVDSKYGIMKEPVDLSTRDYIPLTESDPGRLQLGTPVIGSTSKKWMIPAAVGLADKNGNYLGALTLGFEIPVMAKLLYKVLQNPDVNFALFSRSGNAVLEGDFKSSGPITADEQSVTNHDSERIINEINLGPKKKVYDVSIISNRHAFLAKKIDNYPYIFILNYDRTSIAKELLYVTFTRLSEIFSIIFALTVLLVLIHRERAQALNTFYLKKIAEQANATKTEFLIKTTHEFKNFVFGINGCAEIIKNDLRRLIESLRRENHEKDKSHVSSLEVDLEMSRHIIESSDNIDGFLNHLLQVNDAKDTNFNNVKKSFHPVNIAQIIDLSITSLKKRSKDSETILVKKISKDLYKISNVDPRRIKQIITSVIARAIKNSRIGDVVQIYANNINDAKVLENIYNVYGLRKTQAIEIIIKDNGMSSGENEMMYMMRSTTNRKKSENLKVKIPALKYLIEKQGGIFEVKSVQGQGNEIRIIL